MRVAVVMLAVLSLSSAEPVDVDEWQSVLGLGDGTTAIPNLDLARQFAQEITSVTAGLPAAAMGLTVGDRLIGIDGLRAIGGGEWDLVRFGRTPPEDGMRVTVLRGDTLMELRTPTVLPVRRLGFDHRPITRQAYRTILKQLGFPEAPNGFDQADFPLRAGHALANWSARAPATADRTWITRLADCFQALVSQQWAAAAAIRVEAPASCPEMVRLARFYGAIATFHAQGERDPDPQHHGESLAYYVIHYPYPRLEWPGVGGYKDPDPAFAAALGQLAEDPQAFYEAIDGQDVGERMRWPADASLAAAYANRVRMAVLDPESHGGWPYRIDLLHNPDLRPRLLASLRDEATAGRPDATWMRLCLMVATFTEATLAKRADPLGESVVLLEALDKESPLLSYLGITLIARAANHLSQRRMTQGEDYAPLLLAELVKRLPRVKTAIPGSGVSSRFLAWIATRDVRTPLAMLPDGRSNWNGVLCEVHAALGRELPLVELRRRLADPQAAQLPQPERERLLRMMGDYVRVRCSQADFTAMAGLGLPGLLTELVPELCLWHARDTYDPVWILAWLRDNVYDGRERQAQNRMHAALSGIDWDDQATIAAAVHHAFVTAGTPGATLQLAAACSAHGLGEEATRLQRRATRLVERLQLLAKHARFLPEIRRAIDEYVLLIAAPYPETVPLAIAAAKRWYKQLKPGKDWDSLRLYHAHALLGAGDAISATEQLAASFAAEQIDPAPCYLGTGALDVSTMAQRTWLLRRLAAMPDFANQRALLIQSVRPELVDDDFVALLGVPRDRLGTSRRPADGNDF